MPPGIIFYILNYTFCDQHKMAKMYQYWQETEEHEVVKKELAQDAPWPVGLENGYQCYMNYDLRQEYWDGYMQYIWEKNPDIHAKYNDDFNQWTQFFKSNLITSNQQRSINAAFFKSKPKKETDDNEQQQITGQQEQCLINSGKQKTNWCILS